MAFPGPKPELSDGYPKVSRNRLTYTFRIRQGFRFSTGEPVAARNVAHAIERFLSPVAREDAAGLVRRSLRRRACFPRGQGDDAAGCRRDR